MATTHVAFVHYVVGTVPHLNHSNLFLSPLGGLKYPDKNCYRGGINNFRRNLFCAFYVFKCFCVYHNFFALLDKQWNLNAYTVVKNCWFATTARNGLTL